MRAIVMAVMLSMVLAGCLNKDDKLVRQMSSAANQVVEALGGHPKASGAEQEGEAPVEVAQLVSGSKAVGHRDFNGAKKVLPRVFAGMEEDFYCGCAYRGKTMDLQSCGYVPRKNAARASRLEWEHVVPAWVLGHQRQCWQQGGRKECAANDDVFRMAEGDLNNLVPSVGEVNGDRGNLSYGAWTRHPAPMYGQCQTVVDFAGKRVQPREEVRGRAGRISLYMHQRYGLRMSSQDKKLWCAWAKTYPTDDWELRRNERVVAIQGEGNPLVTDPAALERLCAD